MSVEMLQKLVDLTAAPPVTSDPDELLVAFGEMYLARQEVIVSLTQPMPDTPETRALLAELATRDAAWEVALAASRDLIGSSRRNTTKLRTYAR